MAYSVNAIANRILDLAKEHGKSVSPMQIQKLVYFSHGWCLGLTSLPLINEKIEAWRYGPVVRSLYSSFRDAGSGAINHPAYEVQISDGKMSITVPSIENEADDDSPVNAQYAKDLLEEIWKVYGGFTAIQLSNLSHDPAGPWAKVWEENKRNTIISDDLIRSYFQQKAETSQKDA